MLPSLNDQCQSKEETLKKLLRRMERMLIAYSGGIDSLVLAKIATEITGENALAVIASSPSLPASSLSDAVSLSHELGISLRVIETKEFSDPRYLANQPNRCYYCKTALFTSLSKIACEEQFPWICYGANIDDEGDWRPGMQAAKEFGVRAPFIEARLGKEEIRGIARAMGIRVWDKPAMPCTASRIPYGRPVTVEALRRIEQGEERLRKQGFKDVRVRDHYPIASIEVSLEDMSTIVSSQFRSELTDFFRQLGYQYVALDLCGFRSGSLNELVKL